MTISLCLTAVLTFLGCKSTSEEHVHERHVHDHDGVTSQPTSQPTTTAAINRMCPSMDERVDPDAATVRYKGHTIGFCCGDCVPEWNDLSAAKKDERLKNMLSH